MGLGRRPKCSSEFGRVRAAFPLTGHVITTIRSDASSRRNWVQRRAQPVQRNQFRQLLVAFYRIRGSFQSKWPKALTIPAGVDVRAARRSIFPSTIALVFAAAAALAASVTQADASAREISASSYSFADWLLTNNGLERSPTRSPLVAGWSPECFVNCGPAFGTFVVRRSDLLTSNTADVSARKTADATGQPMGVGGMVVIERLRVGRLRLAHGLGRRVGTRFGRQRRLFMVPVVRPFGGRALAAGEPLPVRRLFVFF